MVKNSHVFSHFLSSFVWVCAWSSSLEERRTKYYYTIFHPSSLTDPFLNRVAIAHWNDWSKWSARAIVMAPRKYIKWANITTSHVDKNVWLWRFFPFFLLSLLSLFCVWSTPFLLWVSYITEKLKSRFYTKWRKCSSTQPHIRKTLLLPFNKKILYSTSPVIWKTSDREVEKLLNEIKDDKGAKHKVFHSPHFFHCGFLCNVATTGRPKIFLRSFDMCQKLWLELVWSTRVLCFYIYVFVFLQKLFWVCFALFVIIVWIGLCFELKLLLWLAD